ncbi:unnamed protein product [Cunninghamella blakesleeana]
MTDFVYQQLSLSDDNAKIMTDYATNNNKSTTMPDNMLVHDTYYAVNQLLAKLDEGTQTIINLN